MLVYMLFLHLPYLKLEHVDINGTGRLSKEEIVEASEIERGANLLTLDLGAVAERLRRHPWIRSASVYRRFPGKLIIEIEERAPRAILAAGKLYYVDEQAECFTRLLPGDPMNYPLFAGVSPEDLTTRGPAIREMVRQGMGLLELLEKRGASPDPRTISEIRIDLSEGLALHTDAGRVIVMGSEDFAEKLERYGRLKQYLIRRGRWSGARIINLDFENRALVRWGKHRLQG
jgi:cell division septal protein FtsQ